MITRADADRSPEGSAGAFGGGVLNEGHLMLQHDLIEDDHSVATGPNGFACGGIWNRAVSFPYTDASGMVVVQVAEEGEYRDALREGRRAVRVAAWPVKQMEVVLPPEGGEEGTQELPIHRSA